MDGGAKIVGVFRVKNHDFTPTNEIFSNCEGDAKIFGAFRVKNHDFTPKNHMFSNFRGAYPGPAPDYATEELIEYIYFSYWKMYILYNNKNMNKIKIKKISHCRNSFKIQ